ncbi:MAG: hypothetical protein ND866_05310 [Pyrinomonadaceae bacterium]|nr:hypothetical protein [Pyrinomonadaceae bacterium]
MGGAVPVEYFAWPIVEHHLHPLYLGVRDLLKPRLFREELPQQTIDGLVRPAFPRALRMG